MYNKSICELYAVSKYWRKFPFLFLVGTLQQFTIFFYIYFILLLKRKCCPICQLQTWTRCFRLSEKLKNIKLSTWACNALSLYYLREIKKNILEVLRGPLDEKWRYFSCPLYPYLPLCLYAIQI